MYEMILDTETANGLDEPMPYDIGYVIFNESGHVVRSRSFVVKEIFTDNALMENAYYADKRDQYWQDIWNADRMMKNFGRIRQIIHADMKEYNITRVGAYNALFDKRATQNDTRYITASLWRELFPNGTTIFCIWNAACSSILQTDDYIKFALKHNLLSEKGNVKTSAEVVYSYLINDVNFKECHTGLEDALIEKAIYCAVKASRMPYSDIPCHNPWLKVKVYYENYLERHNGFWGV